MKKHFTKGCFMLYYIYQRERSCPKKMKNRDNMCLPSEAAYISCLTQVKVRTLLFFLCFER